MKYFFQLILTLSLVQNSFGQQAQQATFNPDQDLRAKPKLVVGVVVDQMRYDYLTRFWDKFGDEGFKKLVSEGFNFRNTHFNYIPTYTGPGHASVYSGGAPESHGIISNSWYDKFEKQSVYCVSDPSVESIGTSSDAGKMSPHRMITTSVADENRLHTQMRGKTIGIALKDRGAILPAGHTANAAYWFHGQDEGKWITSSFYAEALPGWVKKFNASGKAAEYMKPWETLYKASDYAESGTDVNLYEGGFEGKEDTGFPYDLPNLKDKNGGYDLLKATPYGNSLTADFAIASLDGEDLGQDDITDFLTVSFSSTDYVGHNFGVNSREIQDTFLRLDQDLARLLKALDQKVGEGNYTLFLTSDHGGVHVPAYLQSVKIPAGYFDYGKFQDSLNAFLAERFGVENLILNVSNNQIFFNYEEVLENKISRDELQNEMAHFALQYDMVNKVFTRSQLEGTSYTEGLASSVDHGYHQKRSGDVVLVLEPSVISYSRTGSTHGSGQNYDTHAPLIFYGKGIKSGNTLERTEIVDIAPTISALLGISFPNGSTGRPLYVAFEE
ncbi:Type I phosphodiesterase / nucleotide pyrophosphatase [Salinimicrobium catena]|uniref:Type I phosphodiesterase / nucleotide pyrophosphatase n=1 Tax=Salinimicrobium catena TaxID=390640 RepID=A0A1H5NJ69_9FLAO|nr:alkaline phosphatase PafA [Salinimicrobium catena]SDL48470.1 Type I phosphodiesterase / nucleotide pyrophosphatase [Salinimicrobium catena]SEF01722.1 Type I phosphodiesterase / nucleotide pyrophosphatase [Salinimicrobium catena]